MNQNLWQSTYFISALKYVKPHFQRRRAIVRFCMATVHAKYGAKPLKPFAKATLLQSVLSTATMVCMLKYTQNTWDFLLVEMEYQPLFAVFEPSQGLERWY